MALRQIEEIDKIIWPLNTIRDLPRYFHISKTTDTSYIFFNNFPDKLNSYLSCKRCINVVYLCFHIICSFIAHSIFLEVNPDLRAVQI